jgi:hypothetical protein
MAEAVAEGLKEAGCEVDLFNTNEGRFDITQFPQYDCAAFGSPDPSAVTSLATSSSLWTTTISLMCARG